MRSIRHSVERARRMAVHTPEQTCTESTVFQSMYASCWLQDTNTEAINTVRGQLGKCPYANATRCATSADVKIGVGSAETLIGMQFFCAGQNLQLGQSCNFMVPQGCQSAWQLRDGCQPASLRLPCRDADCIPHAVRRQSERDGEVETCEWGAIVIVCSCIIHAQHTRSRLAYNDVLDNMTHAHALCHATCLLPQVKCSLFSRKWAHSASDLVFEALANATSPTGILADWRGRQQTQQEAATGA